MTSYFISAIEYYLPERVIDNPFLVRSSGANIKVLEDKIGIEERHIAREDESTSDMAVVSGRKLLEGAATDLKSIDLLLLCTQNPDYRLPTTACIVQDRLGLPTSCIAFDVNLGCSGYVYSLAIAGNFIRTGQARSALVIMAEQYSKVLDYSDRATATLFGDAAASSLLLPCEEGYGVLRSVYGTDGSKAMSLVVPNSGVVRDPQRNGMLFMDGRDIFKFSIVAVPASVKELLDREGVNVRDITYFIFHQANRYILRELQKRLELSDEQMIIDMKEYGNTVSATIPIAMKNLMGSGRLRRGDLLVLCGFGVGLSWASVLYRQP